MQLLQRNILYVLIILSFFLSIGYSAFNTKLEINDINLTVKIDKDIRVDEFNVEETSNMGISNYEDYDYNKLIFGLTLPNQNSSIKYRVKVSNYGNIDMGIISIKNLPDNLEYKLENYTLKTKICNSNNVCKLGISKEFYIVIKYKENGYNFSNINYNINLELKFSALSSVIKNGTKLTTEVFGKTMDKELIEYIKFVNHIDAPENVESWDASLNDDGSVIAWIIDDDTNGLYNLYIGGAVGKIFVAQNNSNLFRGFSNVKQIDFNNTFDTSNAVSMYNWFSGCTKLISLDLSDFNTSKVTNMQAVFQGCSSLKEINLNSFDTSKVTRMDHMFSGCTSLLNLNISNFNMDSLTEMNYMFYNCTSITNLDLSNLNTNKVTTMKYMLSNCTSLTNINLNNFDTSSATDISYMFNNSLNLTILDLSSFNTSKVTTIRNMLYGLRNLETIYVSDKWDMSSVTESTSMFYNNYKLVGGAGTTWNASYVDATYARIDGGPNSSNPGYLTLKSS